MGTLPGPDRTYTLKISLKMIEEIEAAHGSLYRLTERLVDQSLSLTEMVRVLMKIFRHAGCVVEEEDLGNFLLRQPCTALLSEALLEILNPVEKKDVFPSKQFVDDMIKKFPDMNGGQG